MIAKKDSRLDLEKNRAGLIQIGLLTAGAFTLAAFTYRSPIDHEETKERLSSSPVEIEIHEIQKPKEQEVKQKPEPVKQQQEEPMVKAEMNPNENIEETKSTLAPPDVTPTADPGKFKIGGEDIYTNKIIEGEVMEHPPVPARYVGGPTARVKHIQNVVVYPEISMIRNDEGTVYVSFIVEKDGSISNIKIIKGVTPELDREAKRIVRSFPNWIPAEADFAPVRTIIRLPITFEIDG